MICGVVFYILFFLSSHLSSPLLFVLLFSPLIYPISSFLQTSGQVTLCNEKFIIQRTVIKRLLLNALFLELSSHLSCLFLLLRYCNSFRLICKRVKARVEARLIIMRVKRCVCRVWWLWLFISIETIQQRGKDNITWSIWTENFVLLFRRMFLSPYLYIASLLLIVSVM